MLDALATALEEILSNAAEQLGFVELDFSMFEIAPVAPKRAPKSVRIGLEDVPVYRARLMGVAS